MNVAIIPARGGSKRIPRKNIRMFHGKPIIAYSIEAAKASGLFDAIFVSTDDHETMDIAVDLGCYIHLRSTIRLCGDEAGTQEVAQDCLLNSTSGQYDRVCCIYPCAPTMIAADIGAIYACCQLSQWRDICYVEGWVYWGTAKRFIESPELRPTDYKVDLVPHRWIDINTYDEWERAEQMYAALHKVSA